MRFDYLDPSQGPVIQGLEGHETIYALEQMAEYRPIRTLLGERGNSSIYRLELTEDQRKIVTDGGDILVEILHFGGPLAPSRVMVLNQKVLSEQESENMSRWLVAQLKIKKRTPIDPNSL